MSRFPHRLFTTVCALVAFPVLAPVVAPGNSAVAVATSPGSDASPEITSFIVERLPGRTSLGAQSVVEDVTEVEARRGKQLGGRFETIVLDVPVTLDEAEDVARSLERDGLVVSASPDYPRHRVVAPNDPEWSNQWSLQAFNGSTNAGIGLEAAWAVGAGTTDIVVAVIDTGRPRFNGDDHPDMSGNVVPGYDFMSLSGSGRNPRDGNGWDANETDEGDWESVNDCGGGFPSSAQDSSWHGSHVAGIIAAETNNGIGVAGINPRAKVQHLRVLGTCGGVTSDEVAAIRWAAGLPVSGAPNNPTPAKVINLSLGGVSPCATSEQAAIDAAVAAGAIVVVAAGNSNLDLDVSDYSPANCDNVITVAGTEINGSRLRLNSTVGSNYGSTVEIAAPGRSIRSTMNGGATVATSAWTYELKSGTSMSTPMVSGLISLMLSRDPSLTFVEIRNLLQQSASPFPAGSDCSAVPSNTLYCGAGIANATAVMNALDNHTPGSLVDLVPNRVLDTRDGTGGVSTSKVGDMTGASSALEFDVTGAGGVPTAGVAAVSVNVTAANTSAPNEGGYVTAYPCATGRPNVSTLNFANGQIVANAAIVPVGDGRLCFYVYGRADLIVDVNGWFPVGSGFTPVTPTRVLDSRDGTGAVPVARVGNATGTAEVLEFTVVGTGGIASSGVAAVSVNVTAANTSAPNEGGYVTAYPCATGRPNVSTLNFANGQIVANAAIVPVGDGRLCFYVYGRADLIVDVNGWFPVGPRFTPVTPTRILDTRDGTGAVPVARVGNATGTAGVLEFEFTGAGGVPTSGVAAVSINLTVAETSAPNEGGYVTAYPCATGRPNVSNLNFANGQIVANAAIVPVDTNGRICLHAYGTTHLIVDVNGWFPG